eukprot:COSAG02_NODE_277_length_25939_cov_108.963971_9_plen_638_part_00
MALLQRTALLATAAIAAGNATDLSPLVPTASAASAAAAAGALAPLQGHKTVLGRRSGARQTTEEGPGEGEGRIFGVWYSADSNVAQLPYLSGGQAVVQWADVQDKPDVFNFSSLDAAVAEAIGALPAARHPRFTIQVNGNNHPRFLFNKVPFIPSDNSWSAENKDPCPDGLTPAPPAGTKSCVLQFWHPYFVDQYTKMVQALASHLANVDYAPKLLGVRQNFDAVGTEGTGIPFDKRNSSLWIVPAGVTAAAPFDGTPGKGGTQLDYTTAVFAAHANAFVGGPVLLLARNNLDQRIRNAKVAGPAAKFANTYADLMAEGHVGWFHTSSEMEPRSYGSTGGPGDSPQYETFAKDCARTVCYAEPWADAWGFHGRRDTRWCSPPQWIYWRLLSDLQMGVSNIALYGNDASVAADGVHMGAQVGARYQQEFEAAMEFAARYVGHWANPETAPGAWVAFRESVSKLGGYNKNVTDYSFGLRLLNKDEATVGLDARTSGKPVPIVANKTLANQSSIGPPDSRYGAWARRLRAGVAAHLELDIRRRVAVNGAPQSSTAVINASVIYLDACAGGTLKLCGGGECDSTAVGNSGEWKTFATPKLSLTLDEHVDGDDGTQPAPRLALTAVGCEVIIHMVEVEFGAQ